MTYSAIHDKWYSTQPRHYNECSVCGINKGCNKISTIKNKELCYDIKKINCPNGHITTKFLYSLKEEINYEDILVFYCWICKKEFSFH